MITYLGAGALVQEAIVALNVLMQIALRRPRRIFVGHARLHRPLQTVTLLL